MDPGRLGHQHGWENNSALDRYPAVNEPNFRAGSYEDRRYIDNRFPRDETYPRNYPQPYPYPETDPGPGRGAGRYREPEYGYERPQRYCRRDTHDDSPYDDYDYRPRVSQGREDSRERDHDHDYDYDYDYDYGRRSYDSDYDRKGSWKRRGSRDRDRDRKGLSRERDLSPFKRRGSRDRSRSRGARSRSPRSRSRGRSYSYREGSYDDDRYDKRRDRDEKYHHEHYSSVPSSTVVVKGLSQKTTEEDLHQMLAEWGPLRHVRVIKERSSGVSRGFAFIDFPSTGSARAMMDTVGDDGLVIDGRKLFIEYSKPAGGPPFGSDGSSRSGYRSTTLVSDWMCIICGCVNFARRTACFQCNEPRTDDAPPADMASSNHASFGKKGEIGPTHVLVVRGLDENADEEMLRYEFSKHAPIKDIRLVRDKFTHVSRGFAFVHFHSVNDATKALEATNGSTLDKNGQVLRVAYAKSILGPNSAASSSHSSSLAAAAIEAATFSQQYDAVGWAPKEYDGNQDQGGDPKDASAPQSGFVWDEASGYYYDASSGFYYDGNTGLYYDGNNGIWYSFDQQTQQYVPCNDQTDKTSEKTEPSTKPSNGPNTKKVVISAPAATITTSTDTTTSLPDAVAAAAIAAEKKEKEKIKEIKLASKSSILANKKKMSNVLSMWKQRSHESQPPKSTAVPEEKVRKTEPVVITKDNNNTGPPVNNNTPSGTTTNLRGVIRGSTYVGPTTNVSVTETYNNYNNNSAVPFRTDASALGSYTQAAKTVSGKRRFSEQPVQSASSVKEQSQSHTTYRDRAAERRNLYGSSSFGDDLSDLGDGDSGVKRGGVDSSMPFPPGVGGRAAEGTISAQSYEVITAEKAIDESNVGNRMLRNMGWQEGLGLGKDGSGMVEPVQAQATEKRAGLGSQPKKVDPSLEVQAGDSYRTLIQKKALARFREMS